MNGRESQSSKTPDAPAQLRHAPQRVSSRQLLGERSELVIEHDGREYRLRVTQNRRLILTA